jgi:flagellar biosynthesis/type III secretory pathway chaperone
MSESRVAPFDPVEALAAEVSGYRSLLAVLLAEQEALRIADADALAQASQRKLTLVYALQDLGSARTQSVRDGKFGANADGMHALLAACAQPAEASEQWSTLVALAGDAQRQNALNGRLASVQQRHVDRAMAALWGAAGCHGTYGADGRSQHYAAPRALAAG